MASKEVLIQTNGPNVWLGKCANCCEEFEFGPDYCLSRIVFDEYVVDYGAVCERCEKEIRGRNGMSESV